VKGSFTFREQEQLEAKTKGILADKARSLLENNSPSQASVGTKDSVMSSRLPRTYHDLQKKFVVRLKVVSKQVPNAAVGEIIVSKIPQGRYKIYYLRPRDRVRQIKSA